MMASATLPPGFRFSPTDDELVGYYLKRKVDGQKIELEVIPVINLYQFDPWELPDKSFMPKRDMEWFFFCPRDRKYPNGLRTNRATRSGYWKATGKDRKIVCEPAVGALRKTLVFYRGRAPGGQRTDWVMHEYRLCEDISRGASNFVGAFALCRVIKRNEHGQKTGDFQGEPRAKRALSSAMCDFGSGKDLNNILSSSEESPSHGPSNESNPTETSSENGMSIEKRQILINDDQVGFYGSNDLSNVSQINLLEEGIFSNLTVLEEIPTAIEIYQQCGLTPVSSYASPTEDSYMVDHLHEDGCLSSFLSPMHCIGMYSNEEQMAQQRLEWDSARFMNPPTHSIEAWNTVLPPVICRQTSEGEEVNLWLQEDYSVIVA